MKCINRVELLGNITQDPERKTTQSGKVYVNLTIATNKRRIDQQTGQSTDVAEFHRCKAWGNLAENVCKYLHKGSPVMVIGELHTSNYEKDGQKHYVTEITMQDLIMLPSGKGGNGNQGNNNGGGSYGDASANRGGGYGQQQGGYGQMTQQASAPMQGNNMRPMYDEQGRPLQQQGAAPAGAPMNDELPF